MCVCVAEIYLLVHSRSACAIALLCITTVEKKTEWLIPVYLGDEVDDGGWAQLATWREWAADFARYRALLPEQVPADSKDQRPQSSHPRHFLTFLNAT